MIIFPNGSFMLSWDKVRAWYNPDGSLSDCEYKRGNGVAVAARHRKVREWLALQGKVYAESARKKYIVQYGES